MPVRKRKPTSPGRRFQTVSDFAEITRDKPEKALTKPKPRTGGRNAYGRMTSRHRGGLCRHADVRAPNAAVLDQFAEHKLRRIAGNSEADALRAHDHGGVDADHFASR